MIHKNNNPVLILSIFLFSILISCSESGNNEKEKSNLDSTKIEITENIKESNDIDKKEKSIIELLRSLNEEEYGGVSHLTDDDFKIIDNDKRFIEYSIEEGNEYQIRTFKQIASGERNIFAKASYQKYNSGNSGFFSMGSFYLIEYKDEKWINLSENLPKKWKNMDFAYFLDIDKPEIYMNRIEINKETGEELKRELIETAAWEDGEFIVKSSSETTANQNYKVIVAYAVGEVSEDWNYFYDDIMQYFKNKGVYVVFSDQKKVAVDNADLSVEIDLTDILAKNDNKTACYLFIEKGREAKCVDYDMSDETIKKAKEYFDLK
ncbi:MAG: hypothetical protein DRJ10_19670 [Bacteroidetes bacterium]|nr:MAG: hypothetical protein DRJ10_19670 [Bacteroidota bacterium]